MRALAYIATAMTASVLFGCDDRSDATSVTTPSPDASATATTLTKAPPQARALGTGVQVTPIISVGDPIPGLENRQNRYERVWSPIPDGLGAYDQNGDLVVLANHEITSSGVDGHFPYARVSRLVLDEQSLQVKSGDYEITGRPMGNLGLLFQRLCSATLVGGAEGFQDHWFFTGEETTSGGAEGIQLAVRDDGHVQRLPWLGRFNHENYISVPGFHGKTVMIGTDDTSPADLGAPLASELYMYVADNPGGVLYGHGTLYVFKSSQAANAGDLKVGESISGRFVELPDASNLSAPELQQKVDQRGPFKFVRLEDIDYDRRGTVGQGPHSDDPRVYFVDTGNADGLCDAEPCDLSGSIYGLRLDADDPTTGARLTLLARSQGADKGWASPDNIAVSQHSLMVQEDPAYSGFTRQERIWNFPLTANGGLGSPRAVVELRTKQLTGQTCSETAGTCWESSGIIDVSRYLGAGSWLFDVQAHTLPFMFNDGSQTVQVSKEGGQLLYLHVNGS